MYSTVLSNVILLISSGFYINRIYFHAAELLELYTFVKRKEGIHAVSNLNFIRKKRELKGHILPLAFLLLAFAINIYAFYYFN